MVVLANWAVQQAGKDDERRLTLKWDLTRRLYGIGFGKAEILELFRLVDWLMKLPKELEARFRRQLYEFEQKQVMAYVTSIEQNGIERGIEKGQLMACRENILVLLEARFGTVPDDVRKRVNAEEDLLRLKAWHRLAGTCAKIEDFTMS